MSLLARRPSAPILGAVALLALIGGHGAPPGGSAAATGSTSAVTADGEAVALNDGFGLAHVDLMDLHVARGDSGELIDREVLPAPDLADRFAMARQAGAAWDRWSLYWDMVERRADGTFDWRVADGIVARDVAAGLSGLAILQGTPAGYATSGLATVAFPDVGGGTHDAVIERTAPGPAALQAAPPHGLDAPVFTRSGGGTTDDPELASGVNPANPWARFVASAVDRYRPGGQLARALSWPSGVGVRAWEIGNEPNLRHFWSGTPETFARYLEVGYLAARWSDSSAIVMHGGIADAAGAAQWYGRLLDALRARALVSPLPERYGYYFDRAAWHWYAYPDLLRTGPPAVRRLLSGRGLPAKPIWVTELGVPVWSEHPGPCWDPRSPWRATTTEQAAYVWQAFAEGAAAGVEVMVLFQIYDDCGNGPDSYDAFGLIRNHASNQCWTQPAGRACWRLDPSRAGTARPALGAAQAIARELSGATLLRRPAEQAPRWQRLLFYRPPDTRLTVAWRWSGQDQAVSLTPTGSSARVLVMEIDGAVRERTVTPEAGAYRVDLPAPTNRNDPGTGGPLMAGRPVIVIERDTRPPERSAVQGLPAASPARVPLVVDAADEGTGIEAIQIYVASSDPAAGGVWRTAGGPWSWGRDPVGGQQTVSFDGQPGRVYYFAATARDRAGNWSERPAAAQATTRIVDGPERPVWATALHLPLLARRLTWVGAGAGTPTGAPATPATAATAAPPTGTSVPSAPTTTPPGTPSASPGATTAPPGTPSASPGATTAPPGTPSASATDAETPSRTAAPTAPTVAATPATAAPGATKTPGCWLVSVTVRGARGEVLPAGSGHWTVRAYGPAWPEGHTSVTAPVGQPVCLDGRPERADVWAEVPGYVAFGPQDLARSADVYVAPAPNALVNGTFEAALAGWVTSGEPLPEGVAESLAGRGAARLGGAFTTDPAGDGSAESILSQDVDVPTGETTVAFEYRWPLTCGIEPCPDGDRLDVLVIDPPAAGGTITRLGAEAGLARAARWTHAWYDLTPWSGRRIRLMFALRQVDTGAPDTAWLDNVSVTGPVRRVAIGHGR